MVNESKIKEISTGAKEVQDMLIEIALVEPEIAEATVLFVKHVHGTYADKYQKGIVETGIDTKKMLYNAKNGNVINVYQVARYLQRYNTTGSVKSGLIVDIFKAMHYLLFEIVRRIKMNDINLNEPKV